MARCAITQVLQFVGGVQWALARQRIACSTTLNLYLAGGGGGGGTAAEVGVASTEKRISSLIFSGRAQPMGEFVNFLSEAGGEGLGM